MKCDSTHVKLEKPEGDLFQSVLGEIHILEVVFPKDSHFVWQRFQGVSGSFAASLGV